MHSLDDIHAAAPILISGYQRPGCGPLDAVEGVVRGDEVPAFIAWARSPAWRRRFEGTLQCLCADSQGDFLSAVFPVGILRAGVAQALQDSVSEAQVSAFERVSRELGRLETAGATEVYIEFRKSDFAFAPEPTGSGTPSPARGLS